MMEGEDGYEEGEGDCVGLFSSVCELNPGPSVEVSSTPSNPLPPALVTGSLSPGSDVNELVDVKVGDDDSKTLVDVFDDDDDLIDGLTDGDVSGGGGSSKIPKHVAL